MQVNLGGLSDTTDIKRIRKSNIDTCICRIYKEKRKLQQDDETFNKRLQNPKYIDNAKIVY